MKKALSVIMTLAMFLTVIPFGIISSYASTSGSYTYTITNSEAAITKYNGSDSSVTIPDKLGGYNVTTIDQGAFAYCKTLASVTIPDTVKTIGLFAFDFCSNLAAASIGSGVSTIGSYAFRYCPKLTQLTVKSSNSNLCSEENVVFNKAKTSLIAYASGKEGPYSIPNTVDTIAESAFEGCDKLTGIEIPSGLKSIGAYAFEDCYGLTNLNIPDSVTDIGYMAFFCCKGLKSVILGSGLTTIADDVFHGCSALTSLTFGSTAN